NLEGPMIFSEVYGEHSHWDLEFVFLGKRERVKGTSAWRELRFVDTSKSGVPSLTAHTTGNFGGAELGGNPREIGRVNPDLLKNYLISLAKQGEAVSGYQVTAEATHHGPTSLNRPVLFVEIGSEEKNWNDRDAA